MIVLNNTKDEICVVELTVGFETNIAKNCKRKAIRYKDLCSSLKQRFGKVKYLKMTMGAIGMIGKEISMGFGMKIWNTTNDLFVKKLIV